MKEYSLIIGTVIIVSAVGLWAAQTYAPSSSQRACTMEAKICPDGSAVGRTGLNCEFTPCPAVVATSTTSGGEGASLKKSGVRGTVSLGPTCPVMRIPPDPQCADKPYATAIIVYRVGSKSPYIIGNSDASGAFRLALPLGKYTITAGSGTTLPRCSSTDVTVTLGTYAIADISCDTGIR